MTAAVSVDTLYSCLYPKIAADFELQSDLCADILANCDLGGGGVDLIATCADVITCVEDHYNLDAVLASLEIFNCSDVVACVEETYNLAAALTDLSSLETEVAGLTTTVGLHVDPSHDDFYLYSGLVAVASALQDLIDHFCEDVEACFTGTVITTDNVCDAVAECGFATTDYV